MTQEELERRVRHIQIHCRQPVSEILAGEYRSAFKGSGIEFEGVRQYEHGDDIRSINWSVTARTGKPHVKQFMEERELSLFFLIDISASAYFASSEERKIDLVAKIFALLAFAAAHNNDNVGLILFSDQIEFVINPRKGKKHVMMLISKILELKPKSNKTNIDQALDYFNRIRPKRCVAFVISDFMDKGFQRSLSDTARFHDLICVDIKDQRELTMPKHGIFHFVDSENGELQTVDCASEKFRSTYVAEHEKQAKDLKTLCHDINADYLNINLNEDFMHKIISFFRARSDRSADAK
ncbi:DUF58 domain-containing protein [Lentisphaera profundi]|uniref:DUF58 domain-containing protein n=1 Tax=Lentisphaera profundi TaxID=1658616 RepID=A0ABY7VPH0_9BACT|nr:DUF58 domain-containing protein [Lentisphaera profundi]WDE95602.1 DUF58 domain-containing protein [Lentisphaera profundi]